MFDGCAPWVLVVQHTYYKQLRNNAPGILVQMTASAGFGSGTRHDFAVARTKASMNPKARAYRASSAATEKHCEKVLVGEASESSS